MKVFKKIVLSGILLSFAMLASCETYMKRQSCESTNWYDYGFKVAMKGQWLNADNTILECRKVEAKMSESQLDLGFKAGRVNYCKEEVVTQTGKQGEFFNSELCDPSAVKNLQLAHAKGVEQFCQPANAFTFAANGGVYNKICPEKLEGPFLAEFKKGRKKYLENMIVEKEARIRDAENELTNAQLELNRKEYEVSLAQIRLSSIPDIPANATLKGEAHNALSLAESNKGQATSKVHTAGATIKKLKDELYEIKRELTGLSN